jgi:histidinol-phosphate aminotransferase
VKGGPVKGTARQDILNIKPYQPGKPIEEVRRELGIEGEIIKLASNENAIGPSPMALKALRERLHEICLYPDGSGFALKRTLARHLSVRPQMLALGNGSNELIELILKVFTIPPDDEVIISQYAFAMFPISVQVRGATNVVVKAKEDYGHDLEAMAKAVTERTKIICVPNPNNPTGTVVITDEVEKFMAEIPDRVVVIFDEAYYEFMDRPDYPNTIDYVRKGRNVIVLRTFSKIYGLAGLRIGYAIAQEDIISLIQHVREPFNTSRLSQIAAEAALGDGDHVKQTQEAVRTGKKYLIDQFTRMGLRYLVPTEGNFVTVDFGMDAKSVCEGLLREGVIIRPLHGYEMPNHARITVGLPYQNEKLVYAIENVLDQLVGEAA